MKKIALIIILMASVMVSKAQLANTKWAGVMAIPDETDVYLKFTNDTLKLVIKESDFVGEAMLYSVKDSVITLKKITGNSPCGADPFTVTYSIKGDHLFIKSLLDPCDARAGAWPTKPFDKAADK